MTRVAKRSVSIGGHRTSISLETAFYAELEAIAERRNTSVGRLVVDVDASRDTDVNLSSALRLFVLADLQARLAAKETA
ncbi:ribbon-helix-helix domain-containing protein [Tianweitania sediminis]|uniref:Ribbon-helix-helix domain-containing protein n=1 Tax=Tianweitania sediminis TaxID=1502156 RepID=A0A8J7R1T1_9HYPH|nr:ribbon-helix-helix domain-containing protein [Tianweitania sediminis]